MLHKLQIPRLSSFGLTSAEFPVLVDKAKNASSMKGNPLALSYEELFEVLELSE